MPQKWQTSRFCSTDGCVKVMFVKGGVVVGDSKADDLPAECDEAKGYRQTELLLSSPQWAGGRGAEFVPVDTQAVPQFLRDLGDHDQWYRLSNELATLFFHAEEVSAFRAGVQEGEFGGA